MMAREKVAASPAQEVQITQPALTMERDDIVRAEGGRRVRLVRWGRREGSAWRTSGGVSGEDESEECEIGHGFGEVTY
jgi:hypothetical protein